MGEQQHCPHVPFWVAAHVASLEHLEQPTCKAVPAETATLMLLTRCKSALCLQRLP
jgi:hypothetical protein